MLINVNYNQYLQKMESISKQSENSEASIEETKIIEEAKT